MAAKLAEIPLFARHEMLSMSDQPKPDSIASNQASNEDTENIATSLSAHDSPHSREMVGWGSDPGLHAIGLWHRLLATAQVDDSTITSSARSALLDGLARPDGRAGAVL